MSKGWTWFARTFVTLIAGVLSWAGTAGIMGSGVVPVLFGLFAGALVLWVSFDKKIGIG